MDRSRASFDMKLPNSLIGHKLSSQESLSTNPERYHHLKNKAGNGTHFLPYVDYRLHLDRIHKVKSQTDTVISDMCRRSSSHLAAHNMKLLKDS